MDILGWLAEAFGLGDGLTPSVSSTITYPCSCSAPHEPVVIIVE